MQVRASKILLIISGIALAHQSSEASLCSKKTNRILQDSILTISHMQEMIEGIKVSQDTNNTQPVANPFHDPDTTTLVSDFEKVQLLTSKLPPECFNSNFNTLNSAVASDITQRILLDINRKKNFVDVTKEVELMKKMSLFTKSSLPSNLSDSIELSKKNELAQKDSCVSQDLREEIKPFIGPVQDQDYTGWCFAFQSAAMLGVHFHEQVSATDFALQYNLNKISDDPNLNEEGPFKMLSKSNDDYMDSILSHHSPVCRESQISSDLASIQLLEDTYHQKQKLSDDLKLSIIAGSIFSSDSLNMCTTSKIFPGKTQKDFGDIYHALTAEAKKSPALQAKAMLESACKNPINTSKISIQKEKEFGNDTEAIQKKVSMFNDIDRVLLQKQPVALNMNGCILMNVDHYPPINDPKNCYHAVVVVGSRFNSEKNQCEYLIRSSWGNVGWGKGLEKTKDGHAWISKEAIAKGSMSTWWFNKDKP